uniref:GST C-terminal domain-containing protein n=1 Tax=Haptolina brevifila TaxID=156173 RepID=A0A7S2DI81_9EUKA
MSGLPTSFIDSALASRVEYEASLKLPDAERGALEARARAKSAAATAKDVVIVIPTNNPGKILLFAELNPALKDKVDFKGPGDFGGFASAEYKKINPQGLYPACLCSDGLQLFESTVIVKYLQDKYTAILTEPCEGKTLEARTISNLIVQLHDQYISGVNCTQAGFFSNQSICYKPEMSKTERAARLADLKKQFGTIEGYLHASGPWATGDALTLADISLYPTVAILKALGPRTILGDPISGCPKLEKWFAHCDAKPAFHSLSEKMSAFVKPWPMPEAIKAAFSK